MEIEFLELIKTFDKTMKRLELLDEKILSFKEILDGLRENLDELVELVKLEGIIDLATEGTEKISKLNQQYELLITTYHRLLQIEDIQELNDQRWTNMESRLKETQRLNEQVLEIVQNITLTQSEFINDRTIQLPDGVYLLNHEDNLCWCSTKNKQTKIITPACQIRYRDGIVFASTQNEILVIQNQEVCSTLEIKCHHFEISGDQLYYLTDADLRSYHLLTQQHQLIETDVIQFSLLNKGLVLEKSDGVSVISL